MSEKGIFCHPPKNSVLSLGEFRVDVEQSVLAGLSDLVHDGLSRSLFLYLFTDIAPEEVLGGLVFLG